MMKLFIETGEDMKAKKAKLVFLIALLLLGACGLISSPTATVKSFMAASQKGDVDKMTQLFSSEAIQKQGLDKIRSDNQNFAETDKKATAAGGSYRMENVEQTSIPTGERVTFLYKNQSGTDSVTFVFDLSKEGSAWKIDHIGGAGPEESANAPTSTPTNPSLVQQPPPPLPPSSDSGEAEKKAATIRGPISGGVLNGKATSLPKPVYPPVARAAKASGIVVVQVVLDEIGDVESARAISGHPLLRAAAEAAARNAKFSITKLAGEPVKVKGVITYNFTPE